MEPDKTYMKKAKIELFSNCFAGLSKQNELKNYFKANHSKKSKSSQYKTNENNNKAQKTAHCEAWPLHGLFTAFW